MGDKAFLTLHHTPKTVSHIQPFENMIEDRIMSLTAWKRKKKGFFLAALSTKIIDGRAEL